MNAAILDQVLADVFAGLRDSVERIAGIGDNLADGRGRNGLYRNRVEAHSLPAAI